MKKFIAMLLALILGIIGSANVTKNTVQEHIDRPAAIATMEWTKAYYGRCARHRVGTVTRSNIRNNMRRIARRAGVVLAFPAMLMLGAFGGGYRVSYTNGSKAIVTTVEDNEDDARKAANGLYKQALAEPGKGLITIEHGDQAIAKATIRIQARDEAHDNVATFAKDFETANPSEQGKPGTDEQRTNIGRWPHWMVSAYDENGERIATYKCRSQHHADEIFANVERDGQEAIVWHNLAAAKASNVIAGSYRELKKIKTAHPTVNGPWADGVCTQGVTPTMRHLGDSEVIKINAEIKGSDEEKNARRHAQWAFDISHGFDWGGERFAVYGHGTNAAKDCAVKATVASKVKELREWQTNGASANWQVAIAKYFAYAGLMDVALAKAYPKWLKPESEVILPTLVKELEGNVATCDQTGKITGPCKQIIKQKCSDGQTVISFSKKYVENILAKLTGKERRLAKEFFKELKGHSFRWPLQKGFATVTHIDGMQKFLRAYGITEINGKSIDDIVVFADETVFKGSFGENGSHRDWAEYCEKLERLHDENSRGMLLINHNVNRAASNVSGQFWRAMIGADKADIVACMKQEIEWLKWASTTPEGLGMLVGGKLGKLIAKGHTELLRIRPLYKKAVKSLDVLLTEAKQGRFHNLAHNLAWSTDIFSWVLNAAGIEKSFIPAGVVVVPGAKWITNGQKGLIGRSPIQNESGVQVVTLYNSFEAAGIENGKLLDEITLKDGTAFGSADDLVDTALEADHDGDHIFIIVDQLYVAMVERRNANLASIGWDNVVVKAETGKAKPVLVTAAACQKYLASLTTRVGVGKPDDLMSKLWGYLPVGELPTIDLMLDSVQVKWMMQDAVDAGKNAQSDVDAFEKRDGVLEAEEREIPLSQDQAKSERRHTEMKERTSYEYGEGTLDFIRVTMTEEIKNIEIKLDDLPDLDSNAFKLNDAEQNPAIYGFAGKTVFRFFRELKDGELAYNATRVFKYDSEQKAAEARETMPDGKLAFRKDFARGAIGYADLATWNDETEASRVVDVRMQDVSGKWICDEAQSSIFGAMEGRARFEYYAMIADKTDDEQCKLAKDFMAQRGNYAHKAIEAFASLIGVTVGATYNKVVGELLKPRDWDGLTKNEWKPNQFTFDWFENVYSEELERVLNQDEPVKQAPVVTDDAYVMDEVDELNNLIGQSSDEDFDMDFDMDDLSID